MHLLKDKIKEGQESQNQIEILHSKLSLISKQLCHYNWMYIDDLNEADLICIETLISKKDSRQIDLFFEKHFDDNIELFLKKLLDKNKKRAHIINEIFNGIELKLLYLVIPSIISLIDVISNEKTKMSFFVIKINKLKQYETKLKNKYKDLKEEKYSNKFLFHTLDAIWEYARIQNSYKPSQINRHDIIHGVSLDYGTKINCYKYLSLLLFVSINIDKPK